MRFKKKTVRIIALIIVIAMCAVSALSVLYAEEPGEGLALNSEDNTQEMEERGMYGRFYIPSLDINVALFDGTYEDSEGLQQLVDDSDSAAWFTQPQGTTYIAEHRNQSNMENIKDVVPGETLSYIQKGTDIEIYVCVAAGTGYHCGTYIADENHTNMDYGDYGGYGASFITYTCTRTKGEIYYAIWVPYEGETLGVSRSVASDNGIYACEDVLTLINEARAEAGLSSLSWSDELAEGTVIRVSEQAVLFSHTRPDGSAWYTADSEHLYGEILAKGYYTAETVFNAWMESESHRALILKEGYTKAYCAYYAADDGKVYWAVEFGY